MEPGTERDETCKRCGGLRRICWDEKKDIGEVTHFEDCPDCTPGGNRETRILVRRLRATR